VTSDCGNLGVTVDQKTLRGDQIILRLENLAAKVKLQSADFSDIQFRVYPAGTSYAIDISEGRFSRRVVVDRTTIMLLQSGSLDTILPREVRSAMLTVARRAHVPNPK
jgi:hypothetical protein